MPRSHAPNHPQSEQRAFAPPAAKPEAGAHTAARRGAPSLSHQVARGTIRLLSGQAAARLVDFALYVILARRLGVEDFGLFTFALSFVVLFNVVADLGVSTVLTREVARSPERARALLGDALLLRAASASLAVVAIFAVALATHAHGLTLTLIAAGGISLGLRSAALLFEGLLKAANRAGAVGAATLAGSVSGLIAAVALLALGLGPAAAMIAWGLGGIAHLLLSAWFARDLYARIRPATQTPACGTVPAPRRRLAMLRESLPLALSWVFIALYFRIDAVMLQAMVGPRAVGLYGGVYRIFEAFALVAVAYRSVLFPVMARAADGPREALAVLCRRSIRVHLLFTVLVAVFLTFNAPALIQLVLGGRYADAAPGLAILVWALPGSFMADTMLHLLIAQRRQKLATGAVAATACTNIGLNLLLIPRFSFLGAAAATVASEALCFALLFLLFRRDVRGVRFARTAWRPLAAGAILASALALLSPILPQGIVGLLVGGAAAAVVYTGALLLLRGLTGEDLSLARSLLPGRLAREARA